MNEELTATKPLAAAAGDQGDQVYPGAITAPRTLSALIRQGAARHEQCFGVMRRRSRFGGALQCCALGQAVSALVDEVPDITSDAFDIVAAALGLGKESPKVPDPDDHEPMDVLALVVRLNDERLWPSDKIADYLEAHGY